MKLIDGNFYLVRCSGPPCLCYTAIWRLSSFWWCLVSRARNWPALSSANTFLKQLAWQLHIVVRDAFYFVKWELLSCCNFSQCCEFESSLYLLLCLILMWNEQWVIWVRHPSQVIKLLFCSSICCYNVTYLRSDLLDSWSLSSLNSKPLNLGYSWCY